MIVVRDLIGGGRPSPIELPYNGELAADSTTLRYKGSLVKVMDYDDIDHGVFCTFAGLATAMENIVGILEEEHGTSGNYLPDDGTYGCRLRKISPIFPSTIVRAEYAQADAAGTSNLDTAATATAASTTFTISVTTADTMIGGWIYFTNGANAGYLHYITDNSTSACTFKTAVAYAVAAADDFIVILPPLADQMLFDATYTGLKSEIADGSRAVYAQGLMTYIEDVGIPFQRLDAEKHDGLKLSAPRFYHDIFFPGNGTLSNFWVTGIKQS